MEKDRQYLMIRAEEERFAANRSETDEARRAHLELSTRYEEMANTLLLDDVSRWKEFWQNRSFSRPR